MKKRRGIDVIAVLNQGNQTYISYAKINEITGISIWMIDWHRRHNNNINAEYFEWTDPNLSADKIPGLSLVGCLILLMRDDSEKATYFQAKLANTVAYSTIKIELLEKLMSRAAN
jgi:hypothetical protein